ncbi:MAG TPA: EAL domain-containing protein [Thermomonas sp.]|jgi:diguanylate cyclase (GGDEF)-like protein/PAS domain S-box-containing protein|nr:EAL domain-containing protein [Thermomonas sp.]HPW12633.1 EAL domain-containing protein [Thermomonas sp.]
MASTSTDALAQALRAAAAGPGISPALHALLLRAGDALDGAQAAIEAGNLRYRALFDAVPDPVSVLARDGTVLDLNKAGMRAYNRPREDIIGQPIEVLNPDLPRDHLVPVLETLDRGETYVIEVTNMRADGTRFPVEVHSANLLYDGQDAMVAVARDLSARHDAEVRYNSLIEGIDKAITLQDRQGRVHYMNAAASRIYGIGGDESIHVEPDWNDWLVVDEDGRFLPFEAHPASRALATGQAVSSQVLGLFRRSTQRLLWLSVTAVPQFAPGADQADMVLTLSSDITELQRDKALFDRVQELAQIGGWQWDRASGALYLTREASRILGAAQALDAMEQVLACLREDDRERLRRTLESICDGTGFELELQGAQADGSPFWVRMIGEPDPHDPGSDRLSGTLQDITERKHAEHALRLQAQTDALTGLMNRDAILEQITLRMRNPGRSGLCLLYIDLDRFKIVNDVLGHNAGDTLLVDAAQRIAGAVGSEGLIARFGGDEFLVACRADDDHERPQRLAKQIQQAFGEPFRLGKDEFNVTTSIGIARAPDDGETPNQLIQSADVAMYDSKRRQRNGFQSFSPELASRQHERLQTETQLRRALDKGEFHLVYQPQVDLRTGRILYAEALVRWRNPQLGEMRPDRFIELAETTGDIIRIGQWVLQEACAQMRRWREQDLPIQRVAVNVSYRQFLAEDFGQGVQRVLQDAGLPGHALELELTERVLVDDAADSLEVFDRLRRLGVQLSIDDFGEGYSALNYLRRLPIHALKLSQTFIKGVPGKPSDVAICQAVAGIASSLGLGLVAEGIETESQRDFLIRLGVKVGQGFLFAPGLLPGEFAKRVIAQQD